MTIRVGVVGWGAIGRELVVAIADGRAGDAVCPAVLARKPRNGATPAPVLADADAFFGHRFDVVVEVEAEGAFGRFRFLEDVLPLEANRKTGRIVAMALIKTVRQLSALLVVGA